VRKKILILTTCFRPNVGGVETHLDDLINDAGKKGFSFFVLTYQPLISKTKGEIIEKKKLLSVLRIPWLRFNLFLRLNKHPALEFLYLFPGLFAASFIFFMFKSSEVEVIHAQGLVAGAVGLIIGKIFNKKVIVSTHSVYNFPDLGLYPKFIRLMFINSDYVLTLSQQSKTEVVNLGVPKKKVSVFTYWVNQNIFRQLDKRSVRRSLGISKEKFICLFVGRLVPEKGVNELLESVKISNNNITFLVIGDGPMKDDVTGVARVYKNLIFVGRVDNEKLFEYYNASNLLIVPSIHEEGFGRVILESLSCGLPVIATNRGGIREYLSKKIGVLIDITPLNIKVNVEKLMENPKALNKMSANARAYANKHFNRKNVTQIIKYYGKEK